MYSYYIGFLAFVQIAVALDFGFLILDKKSMIVQFQNGFFNWIRGLYKKEIEDAQHAYGRVRDQTMPQEYVDKKRELQGLLSVFDVDAEYKSVSLFMPGLGFVAGFYSLLFLLIVPFWAEGGNPIRSIDLFELATESAIFAVCMMPLTLYFRSSFQNAYTCIMFSMTWMLLFGLFATVLYCVGLTWGILQISWFFYIALAVPYVPVFVYIVRLGIGAWKRYRSIDSIVKKTVSLATELDNYREQH